MTIQELDLDIDFLCGTTSASYSTTNKRRNMNIALHDVARLIWDSEGEWRYDDSNATTLPFAQGTLVHNQQDYSLPATSQRVESVLVKNSDGDWQKLKFLDIHDREEALPEFLQDAGIPLYYELVGRSINLYPKPHSGYVTLASGLGVYVSRDVTEIAVTATTTTPGFPPAFHRILSYSAALDFVQDQQQRNLLLLQKDRLEKGLSRFYSKRASEGKTQIRPRSKKTWRQYT